MAKYSGHIFVLILSIYLGAGNAVEPSTEQFPFLASIQAPAFRGRQHSCNGAIINENWVLTIGNCVLYFDDPHAFKIRVGGTDGFDGDDYTVDRKEFHPLYSVNATDYNFALLRVITPMKFNDLAKSIDIISTTLPIRADQTGVLVGWGYTSGLQYERVALNSVDVITLEKSECGQEDNVNLICARVVEEPEPNSIFTCNGAAGSLLLIDNKLIALSPFGVGCQQEKESHVLTLIDAETETWITETIQ